jgi:hypothetical protein
MNINTFKNHGKEAVKLMVLELLYITFYTKIEIALVVRISDVLLRTQISDLFNNNNNNKATSDTRNIAIMLLKMQYKNLNTSYHNSFICKCISNCNSKARRPVICICFLNIFCIPFTLFVK